MFIAVFRRRLKPGKTYEDFEAAWVAEQGFGVPAHVFSAVRLDDEREVLTVGFVDVAADDLASLSSSVQTAEAQRESRIDEVIESTELRAMYELKSEHDFSDVPKDVILGSSASMLAPLVAREA